MKALLKNYHQSPRKVRLIADLIRGRSVVEARTLLAFKPQKSSPAVLKLLNSEVANARMANESLFVKTITVNKGMVMSRFMPKARGRATRYHKTMSIVVLELATNATSKKAKVAKKAAKKKSVAK